MATTVLPIMPATNQTFTCTLPIGSENITLDFSLTYNTPGGYWFMGIADHSTGNSLVDALPLVPGDYPAANLLGPHKYLNIGSVVLMSVTDDNSMPTFDSLGKDHILVWSDNVS